MTLSPDITVLSWVNSDQRQDWKDPTNFICQVKIQENTRSGPTVILILHDRVAAVPWKEALCHIPLPETKALALYRPWLTGFS